jgi:hypothetical protein
MKVVPADGYGVELWHVLGGIAHDLSNDSHGRLRRVYRFQSMMTMNKNTTIPRR